MCHLALAGGAQLQFMAFPRATETWTTLLGALNIVLASLKIYAATSIFARDHSGY